MKRTMFETYVGDEVIDMTGAKLLNLDDVSIVLTDSVAVARTGNMSF